ncbi:hypothetical protein [Bacillus sp. JCM 19041]|uniref:hypothetical protein n=1 Tax=Bacillus sp. JCM 19041 TaxID=1460637 RepID=UPI00336A471F
MLAQYKTLDERFKLLGFTVGIGMQVYVMDLSRRSMLVVEGVRKSGYSTYRYTFYKMTCLPGGGQRRLKVYEKDVSAKRVYTTSSIFFSISRAKSRRGKGWVNRVGVRLSNALNTVSNELRCLLNKEA